jgi:asparagine synthase (glutamine-hydrolysing)
MLLTYDALFPRGYIVTDDASIGPPQDAPWSRIALSETVFALAHPLTATAHYRAGHAVLIVGHAFDLDAPRATGPAIARTVHKRFAKGGFEEALLYVAYLGGRHAVFIVADRNIYAIPDCASTYAIFQHSSRRGFAFASNYNLLDDVLKLGPAKNIAAAMADPAYVSPQGTYYPAKWIPVRSVYPVIANCYAKYAQKKGRMTHKRFYPFAPLPRLGVDDGLERFRDRFLLHVACMSRRQRIALPLTAGLDSRTTFAALRHLRRHRDLTTFSYMRLNSPTEFEDVVGGNRVSFEAGVLHRVVPMRPVDPVGKFHKMFARSFRRGSVFESRAEALWHHIPHDRLMLLSVVAEVGGAFYQTRDAPLDARTLARKFTTSGFNKDPRLVEAFEAYIDYTQLRTDRIANFDFYDLFYWEHRLTKWGALFFSELNLSHDVISPFNQRGIVEAMLSVDLEERKAATLQQRLIAALS